MFNLFKFLSLFHDFNSKSFVAEVSILLDLSSKTLKHLFSGVINGEGLLSVDETLLSGKKLLITPFKLLTLGSILFAKSGFFFLFSSQEIGGFEESFEFGFGTVSGFESVDFGVELFLFLFKLIDFLFNFSGVLRI